MLITNRDVGTIWENYLTQIQHIQYITAINEKEKKIPIFTLCISFSSSHPKLLVRVHYCIKVPPSPGHAHAHTLPHTNTHTHIIHN